MLGFFELHAAESWSATNSDLSFTFSGSTCTGGGAGAGNYVSAFISQRIFNNQKFYFEDFGGSGGFGFGNPNASYTRLICTPSAFLYTPPVGFRAPNSMATR